MRVHASRRPSPQLIRLVRTLDETKTMRVSMSPRESIRQRRAPGMSRTPERPIGTPRVDRSSAVSRVRRGPEIDVVAARRGRVSDSQCFLQRYLGALVNAAGTSGGEVEQSRRRPRRSPKPRGTVEVRKNVVSGKRLSRNWVSVEQQRAERSNSRIQLTVRVVTPRAGARVAPTQPAADPAC